MARLPKLMEDLPTDAEGRPIPWFVYRAGRKPNFNKVASGRTGGGMRGRCWICGKSRGEFHTFLLRAADTITRNTRVPASHRVCAEYSVQVCPWFTGAGGGEAPVIATWTTERFDLLHGVDTGIFEIGPPEVVTWWKGGRLATWAEVDAMLTLAWAPIEAEAKKRNYETAVARYYRDLLRAWTPVKSLTGGVV
jgi:hypothetical protein